VFVKVALDLPLDSLFTYKVSGWELYPPEVGKRAVVPFGPKNRLTTGIVVEVCHEEPEADFEVKEVLDFPDPYPLFTPQLIELAEFTARYYCSSLGEALFSFLPESFVVKEEPVCELVEEGELPPLTEKELALYRLLKERKGTVKLSSLRRLKFKNLSYYLKKLREKGLLKFNYCFKKGSVPKEKWLRFLKDDYRGPKGRQLLNLLKEKGPIPVKRAKELGFSDSVISNLLEKGCAELFEKELLLENRPQELHQPYSVELTPAQKKALNGILKGRGVHLLYGVTGSGKMEVYLQAARRFLEEGKSVIITVPELLLTPELRSRVEAYFGKEFALYHGRLTPREKASTWLKALKGEAQLFLGTRLAVTLPVKNLGLIVVDEEQDPSYKEQQKPYYNARTLAVKRSEIESATTLLVSATPSVETYHRALKGEYKLHYLPHRVSGLKGPKVELLNLKEEKRVGLFTEKLLEALKRTLQDGLQSLLFVSRRGFYSQAFCPACGLVLKCKKCEAPLTYHKSRRQFVCHLCGTRYRPVYRCPECKSRLEFRGYGTERVEEELQLLFPQARVVRLDADTVKDPIKGAKLIKAIKEGEYDFIVGTYLSIKGHNFPNLALVGVLVADALSGAPDFRASERIFQSLVHAVGRVGRFRPGYAVVQAFDPQAPAIKAAVEGNYSTFYSYELAYRRQLWYPPYSLGVLLEFQLSSKEKEPLLKKCYKELSERLSERFKVPKLAPAPIPFLNGAYRYLSYLRTDPSFWQENLPYLKKVLSSAVPSSIRYKIDVEPNRIL